MKKLLFALIAMGFGFSATAQDSTKDVVLVDFFKHSSSTNASHVANLRTKVIAGIAETGRLQLVDMATQGSLATEEARRQTDSYNAEKNSIMQTLGAKYIITGEVTTMSCTREYYNGNVTYKGNLTWTISIVDVSNGTTKYTKTYTYQAGNLLSTTGSGRTYEEAMLATCDKAKYAMAAVVNEAFPIEGLLLKVETTKKNKAETVYIDLGSASGISAGQGFEVYVEVDIAGELSRKQIGDMIAKEVLSASRTLCNVKKGGDLILNAATNGQKLIVVSRAAKGLEGIF